MSSDPGEGLPQIETVQVEPSTTLPDNTQRTRLHKIYEWWGHHSGRRFDVTWVRARLDKSGTYVLCGRVDCGSRLARVARFTEVDRARAYGRYVGTGIWTNLIDHIHFLPGWAPEPTTAFPSEGTDFIWEFSINARKRDRSGRAPALRRYPKGQGHIIHNDAWIHHSLVCRRERYAPAAWCAIPPAPSCAVPARRRRRTALSLNIDVHPDSLLLPVTTHEKHRG